MTSPDANGARPARRERRTLLVALAVSVLLHLAVVLLVRSLPGRPPPRSAAVQFTLVERPVRPPTAVPPLPQPPRASGGGGVRSRSSATPGTPGGSSAPALTLAGPDAPFAVQAAPPGPSLQEASEQAAAAVVKSRGPLHPAGQSIGERLAEKLQQGVGERSVDHSGTWDAYFTELRKALMAAWPATRAKGWSDRRRASRIRLVIDAEGLLRDFEIVDTSGDAVVDHEVEQAIHLATRLPTPPARVLHGKAELVTEWKMTVHPGLAPRPGSPVLGPLGVGIAFDMVTLFDSRIDLTPLERNVTLSSYWAR